MKVASGPFSCCGFWKMSAVRKASQQEEPGCVHITAETPTAEAARAPTRAVKVVSGCLPLKSNTLPERVAPNGNQESLMAYKTGLPPWTLPTSVITSEMSRLSNNKRKTSTTIYRSNWCWMILDGQLIGAFSRDPLALAEDIWPMWRVEHL